MSSDATNGNEQGARLAAWRTHLERAGVAPGAALDELEESLAAEAGALRQAGLDAGEAFLIAVQRIGKRHEPSRGFARHYVTGLLGPPGRPPPGDVAGNCARTRKEAMVAIGFAVLAAAAIKVPALFGRPFADSDASFYARNISLFVLPCVAAYFGWKHRLATSVLVRIGLAFAAAAVLINTFPFAPAGATETLAALHLPIALWLVVGVAYTGGRWSSHGDRMRFVRFSGEAFIHFVLIALGGVVVTAVTLTLFQAIGVDTEWVAEGWVFPCGALGAVVISSWLADTRASVAGSMAPVLTRIFTPLCAVGLLAFLLAMVWTGTGVRMEREILLVFDMLLALVAGLVLYAVSARATDAPPGVFDAVQLVLVVLALAVDALALGAIFARISEFGFSANRTAVLGENVLLFASLAGSAWLYLNFLRGRRSFAALERWQTAWLPVYAGWAAVVVAVLPLLFGFQ